MIVVSNNSCLIIVVQGYIKDEKKIMMWRTTFCGYFLLKMVFWRGAEILTDGQAGNVLRANCVGFRTLNWN